MFLECSIFCDMSLRYTSLRKQPITIIMVSSGNAMTLLKTYKTTFFVCIAVRIHSGVNLKTTDICLIIFPVAFVCHTAVNCINSIGVLPQ